ncbi:ABC transporter substrate-binding protein [Candidatus Magnetomorum sp. HK-1]|nr:ABC transporter substrate-binding protein [Candidatus Magnetomorum sp. HK-1]
MAYSNSKKKNFAKWFTISLIFIFFICFSSYKITIKSNNTLNQNKIRLRFGLPLQPSSGLLIIALEKGYFNKHGLKMIVKEYPSGKRSLKEGLFKDELDMSGSADFPVAISSMNKKDFKIITSTFSTNNVNSIIARKDAGIKVVSDLRGKTIGTQRNSAVHYFLHLFLLENQISDNDINFSFMKAENLPIAIADKRIDAFSMREPYIGMAKKLLNKNHVIFSSPGLYDQYDLILIKEKILNQYPTISYSILKALIEAENYVKKYPDIAISLIAKRLNADANTIAKLWPYFIFRTSLEQLLIIRLEDEARWLIRQNPIALKNVPNYLELIHIDTLKELNPDAVTIF